MPFFGLHKGIIDKRVYKNADAGNYQCQRDNNE